MARDSLLLVAAWLSLTSRLLGRAGAEPVLSWSWVLWSAHRQPEPRQTQAKPTLAFDPWHLNVPAVSCVPDRDLTQPFLHRAREGGNRTDLHSANEVRNRTDLHSANEVENRTDLHSAARHMASYAQGPRFTTVADHESQSCNSHGFGFRPAGNGEGRSDARQVRNRT